MEHRQYKFQSSGIIQYDPPRPGLKRKKDWWCIVKTDEELSRYYRWLLNRRFHLQTHPPSWGSHISIIRGEKPPRDKMHLWKKYDGQRITFDCTHDVFGNGEHWWLNVYHPLFAQIRDEFGFPSDWGMHLTIARQNEKWPARPDQYCLTEGI